MRTYYRARSREQPDRSNAGHDWRAGRKRIQYMRAQDMEDELEEGLSLISELVEYAETFKRSAVPLSKLKIGLKCGGSDGLSGITANPLAGRIADTITAHGALLF